MTAGEVVKTSVTNSLSQDYDNLDDLPATRIIDFLLAPEENAWKQKNKSLSGEKIVQRRVTWVSWGWAATTQWLPFTSTN